MCTQRVITSRGISIEGVLVSWEADGKAIIRVNDRDYLGTRAEVHDRRQELHRQALALPRRRSSIRSQPEVAT